MTALLLSLFSFFVGPIFFQAVRQRQAVYALLDGLVLVGVAGLVLVEVLPGAFQAVGTAGWQVLVLAALGFLLPFFLERRLSLFPFSPTNLLHGLVVLGLFFHQTLDGMALNESTSMPLQVAVVLHQLPKGFLLWSLLMPTGGRLLATLVIVGLSAATVGGFFLGNTLTPYVNTRGVWLFQAFVAGGLLHVILHHVPGDRTALSQRGMALWSGLGTLAAFALLCTLHYWSHEDVAPTADTHGFDVHFLNLLLASAPSIILGLAAAGFVHSFLPKVVWKWFHGRGRLSQTIRGIAIGIPLPICSCGVAPVFLSLVKHKVPIAAALAFLIATPEIGLDSVFLSWKLLGLKITLIRLSMAFLVALAVGLTISRLIEKRLDEEALDLLHVPEEKSENSGKRTRLLEAVRFGAGEIVDEIGVWLLAGIAVAALLQPLVAPEWFSRFSGRVDVFLFSLMGLPVYVCASGATPLAAVLIFKGLSIGAVLVFLITGPATNLTTFGILKRSHGILGAASFAAAVFVFSVLLGFSVNWLFPKGAVSVPLIEAESHGWLAWSALGVLLALIAGSLLRRGPRGFLSPLGEIFLRGPVLSEASQKESCGC